jgi:ElaB/YqjD/DUF883 family membrane-anchored ribosome-binding protein
MNNNPRFNPSSSKSTESIQSEIDTTRRRMDDTIDAITSRLKGRHIVDEVIGFFRSSNGNGNAARIKERVSESASTAVHSVVDTVKAHPLPTLMIGAGIAWMLYERRRSAQSSVDYDPDDYAGREAGSTGGWEEDVPYDYPSSDISGAPSVFSGDTGDEQQNKLRNMKEQVSSKVGAAGERLRHRTEEMKARYREQAQYLRERMQSGYSTARQQISSTVERHPLESGMACLALGVIAGLLIPPPRAVRERVAPAAERLRQRAREAGQDLVERGKQVAHAAAEAVREEAEHQGLTPEALKQKAGAVADRARDATKEAASQEGLNPTGGREPSGSTPNPPTSSPSGF